MKMKLLVVRCD